MTLPDFDPVALKQTDPDKYWEFVARLRATVPLDEQQRQYQLALADKAREGETLEAFEAFYEGIHGNALLPHNLEAAKECFTAFEQGEIFLYLAARGFRKTTTFGITLCSWLLGLYPEKTGIVTGANDPNAKLIAKSISQIIEYHPFYRMAFPNVVVDKEKGWGAEGYWIRDNRISREDWTKQQSKVNDPSFVGGGYKSSEINGKHPSLFLLVDDLHDIDSSGSVTERESIKMIFLTQILKTVLRERDRLLTKVIMTGVPFAKDDTYAVLRQAGGTRFVNTPVMRRAAENAKDATYIDGINPKTGAVYQDIVGWWYLVCPEIMGAKGIINARSEGKSAFWQMFMLDMESAKSLGLTYYLYDHTKIGFDLPTVGGADPTSIDPDYEIGGQKRSSFALCYLCKLPMGGAVVKDGVLKPMGIVDAKMAILQAQAMFSKWETTGVEGVGPGKMFQQYLRTDSRVRFLDSNIKTPDKKGVKDKKSRFEYEVSPWLDSAVIRISDEPTPFNLGLRYLLDNFFDIDANKPHASLDAGDSLYHAAKLIPEILRTPASDDISPQGLQSDYNGLWHPLMGARR